MSRFEFSYTNIFMGRITGGRTDLSQSVEGIEFSVLSQSWGLVSGPSVTNVEYLVSDGEVERVDILTQLL